MISAYGPKPASPFPGADPVPFPFAPFDELFLGDLSEEPPPFSDLWAAGEGTFLAVFSSSFLEGDLCARLSPDLDFGVLLSSGVGFAAGLALALGVGLGVDFGVGFRLGLGLGFGVAEGLGFGDGVGFGVGFGVTKFGGGVGVT